MRRRDVLGGMAAAAATGWSGAHATVRGVDAAGDIDILRRAYTQLHPGLYRYASRAQVDRRFASLSRAFSRDQSLAEAYRTLSRFLGTVQCGHTYANFYNQSRAVSGALFAGRDKLPFHFRMLGGRMVVTKTQSDDPALARGAEIRSIDGRAPAAIMRALVPYARADGGNDAKRRALLEVRGLDRYESFDVYYPLLFPVRDAQFQLSVLAPGARGAKTITVPALDLDGRRAGMQAADVAEGAPAWTLAINDGAAILTMPNWALYNSKWDWRAFLDDAMAQAAEARALIVDLRGNEGGLDCGHEIIARLIDRDLVLDADARLVRYRKTPADLDPYLDTWDDSFRDWGADATDRGDGFFALAGGEGVTTIAPKGPRFRGQVIVLTDAQNSSATFQFAQIVQKRGLARLVGGATGGNQRGINGGAFFFLRLPACGLEADLPLIARFPKTPMPDAGLAPDVAVEDAAADVAAGRDRVLETALALARG